VITLEIKHLSWPVRGSFTISRGSRTSAETVMVVIADDAFRGRGECVPYAHYGESLEGVTELIESIRGPLESGMNRAELQSALPSGAARNALDCALWDLEAKRLGVRAWQLPDIDAAQQPITTAFTLSLDSPDRMREAARASASCPLLKIKLGGEDDLERVRAVREGAPQSRLILDANEGWNPQNYESLIPVLVELGVEMIEQPFPAAADEVLRTIEHPITICADEACHDIASFGELVGKYDMINIKLDKTGGLTEAMKLKALADGAGMQIMVGCMLGSSLAMAPACIVAQGADIVDLDGPLLLADDCQHGLIYENSVIQPGSAELWG